MNGAFTPGTVPAAIWDSGELPVTGGKVSFGVPVAKSQGLNFEVTSPKFGGDAVPIAVVRYPDVPVGTTVTAPQAATNQYAFGCWAGSTFAEETLSLQVDWYTGKAIAGKNVPLLRAYFNPGMATYGTAQETFGGGLGHQNVWSCSS